MPDSLMARMNNTAVAIAYLKLQVSLLKAIVSGLEIPGNTAITLDDVLMVASDGDVKIGTPKVDGAQVTGTIVAQGRGRKIRVFKMKRRKGYKRSHGHRQDYTEIRVDSISG